MKKKRTPVATIDPRFKSLIDPDRDSSVIYQKSTKASDRLYDLILCNPKEAWPIIVSVIKYAPNEIIRGGYAVAFIETLLLFHGKEFIEEIKKEAQHSLHFRNSLRSIHQKVGNKRIHTDLFKRIRLLTGLQPHDLPKIIMEPWLLKIIEETTKAGGKEPSTETSDHWLHQSILKHFAHKRKHPKWLWEYINEKINLSHS